MTRIVKPDATEFQLFCQPYNSSLGTFSTLAGGVVSAVALFSLISILGGPLLVALLPVLVVALGVGSIRHGAVSGLIQLEQDYMSPLTAADKHKKSIERVLDAKAVSVVTDINDEVIIDIVAARESSERLFSSLYEVSQEAQNLEKRIMGLLKKDGHSQITAKIYFRHMLGQDQPDYSFFAFHVDRVAGINKAVVELKALRKDITQGVSALETLKTECVKALGRRGVDLDGSDNTKLLAAKKKLQLARSDVAESSKSMRKVSARVDELEALQAKIVKELNMLVD